MKGILVETDILVEYLTAPAKEASHFRRLLGAVVCYSTFVQTAEIYSATIDAEERRTVDRALFGLKVLGANSRYAKTIGDLLSSLSQTSVDPLAPEATTARGNVLANGTFADHKFRIATVAAMAIESNLPLVTGAWEAAYRAIPGVRIVTPRDLDGAIDSDAIKELFDRSA